MTKIKQIICIILLLLTFNIRAQNIIVGANQTRTYLPLIKNKNVGVIANQTSNINETHLVDSLISLNIEIIKIFSPEHGFRGEKDAGEKIKNDIDNKTGLQIISLYGENKKPTNKQLEDIDIIIFDIQDVGVRFYTYISTLHYVMEAAAENNIPIIVLDRPNPNGHYIDGPVLKESFNSFVGMHPVPIVYGMTIGEYAKMINGEKWIKEECDLTIIPIINYSRKMVYNLPVKPSPNLPNSRSVNLYPSLCLFEGTTISIGRGTKYPFQHYGAPYLKSNYTFIPKSNQGSKYPKYENKQCFGNDLRFQDNYLTSLNLKWLINSYNECPNKANFFNDFFDKLAGNDDLRKSIIALEDIKTIKKSWQNGLKEFKKKRSKYLIYN